MVGKVRIWFQALLLGGGGKRVLSRWTWELPQTLLGLAILAWALGKFRKCEFRVVEGVGMLVAGEGKSWGAISLGSVVVGDERLRPGLPSALFMHEFGHVLQSRRSGPLYLWKYGLPSVVSASRKKDHCFHPVEQDANLRARAYFADRHPEMDWPDTLHPIQEEAEILRAKWWEYLPGPFPLYHLWCLRR